MKYITWKNNPGIIGGTSLRNNDKGEFGNMALHVGGNLDAVIENREELSADLGITLNDWVFPQQTHSDHIKQVSLSDAGRGSRIYEDGIANCDALYTKDTDLMLAIMHADCVPVLLYDKVTGIICAIHSGWQGTVKEITRKSLQYLIDNENVDPVHVKVYIGPAIAHNSFEVDEDVLSLVKAMSFDTSPFITYKENGKALVDNKGLNKQMLLDLGVCMEHITVDKNDTFTANDSLFSYRRDPKCGRHVTFIMRKV